MKKKIWIKYKFVNSYNMLCLWMAFFHFWLFTRLLTSTVTIRVQPLIPWPSFTRKSPLTEGSLTGDALSKNIGVHWLKFIEIEDSQLTNHVLFICWKAIRRNPSSHTASSLETEYKMSLEFWTSLLEPSKQHSARPAVVTVFGRFEWVICVISPISQCNAHCGWQLSRGPWGPPEATGEVPRK